MCIYALPLGNRLPFLRLESFKMKPENIFLLFTMFELQSTLLLP